MPLTRIEIEQTAGDRWVAEIEVGGLVARRETVLATSFGGVMDAVGLAYWRLMPKPAVPAPEMATEVADAGGAWHPPMVERRGPGRPRKNV